MFSFQMRLGTDRAKPLASLGALAVVASLTLAACGSSSSSSSQSSSGSSSTGSSASGTPIVIGTIGDFTGASASAQAGAKTALNAWVTSVNDAGGISGHPIKLISADGQGNVATTLTAVKKLVESDHVIALVGESSGETSAFQKYIESKNIPVVGGNPSSIAMSSSADFFPDGTTITPALYGQIALAKNQGRTNVGLFYCAESAICAQIIPLYKKITASLGMKLGVTQSISASAPSYTAPCLAAKDAGVDALSIADVSEVVLKMASACTQNGYKPTQTAQAFSITKNWLTNPAMDGLQAVSNIFPWYDDSTPASKAYMAALKKEDSSFLDTPSFNPAAAYGWTGGKLFEAAVNAGLKQQGAGGDVTSDTVLNGLYSLNGETLDGLIPPVTFVKGKPTTVPCYFTVGINGGKFTEPNGMKTSCVTAEQLASLKS